MSEQERLSEVQKEISQYMPCEEFVRIQLRLTELRKEEENKLLALADLQKAYLSANSDAERDSVKEVVVKIRELSKAARQEIKDLNAKIVSHLPLELARTLYDCLLEAQKEE